MNKYLLKIAKEQSIDEGSALKRSLKTTASSLGSATLIGGAGAVAGGALAHKSSLVQKGLRGIGGAIERGLGKSKLGSKIVEKVKPHMPTTTAAGAVIGHQVGEGLGDFAAIHHGTRKAMEEGNKK